MNEYKKAEAEVNHRYKIYKDKMVIGIFIILFVQAFGVLVYVQTVSPLPSAAVVSISPNSVELSNPNVCPGDKISYEVILSILEPSVIEADISIISMETGNTVFGTEYSIPARPRDRIEEILVPIVYTVPDLPPGDYRRVTGLSPKNRGADSAFSSVYFTVVDGC